MTDNNVIQVNDNTIEVKDNVAHLSLSDTMEGGVLLALSALRAAQNRLQKIPEEDFYQLWDEAHKLVREAVEKMMAEVQKQFFEAVGGKVS